MKKTLLAVAAAIALATGMTTSAMAFGHGGGAGFHGGGMGGFRGGRFSGLRGFRGGYAAMHGGTFAGPGWHDGRRFVGGYGYGRYGGGYGPYDHGYYGGLGLLGLGVGLAAGDGYCSPYEVDYDYCGSSYVIGR
jgi:hypothetical protein